MGKSKFIIKRPDDETIEVYIGKKQVGTANHDEDGWGGMESLESIVRSIAKALKMEVDEECSESEDEDLGGE